MVLPECPDQLKPLPRVAIQPQQLSSATVALSQEQRHYLERVRRLHRGDPFLAFDGSGRLWRVIWQGEICPIDQELQPVAREVGVDLHLGLALIKGGGFDETIRQVTELGVSQISPLLTQRTLVQPSLSKQDRWQKIALEATEQSERLCWPQIHTPLTWEQWLSQRQDPQEIVLMAMARGTTPHLLSVVRQFPRETTRIAIAIGPEGGWTQAEIQSGRTAGAQLVGLGPRILRAATAPLLATGLVAAIWESEP